MVRPQQSAMDARIADEGSGTTVRKATEAGATWSRPAWENESTELPAIIPPASVESTPGVPPASVANSDVPGAIPVRSILSVPKRRPLVGTMNGPAAGSSGAQIETRERVDRGQFAPPGNRRRVELETEPAVISPARGQHRIAPHHAELDRGDQIARITNKN